MPLYEYECDACGHRFEVIQKMSDPPVEKCPVCGGTVHKLQSAPAFQFKGSGWYVTDYAKKDGGKGAKADGAGESSKDSGKDSGKESGKDSGKDSGKESGKESGKDSRRDKSDQPAATGKADKTASTRDTKASDSNTSTKN